MRKLLILLVLFGCKKEHEPQTMLPPRKYEPCIAEQYAGLYKTIGYTGINYPNTNDLRFMVTKDSVMVEFLGQTKVN